MNTHKIRYTATAFPHAGVWPVFIAAGPDYWPMDPQALADFLDQECVWSGSKLTNKRSGRQVKAVLPVHILGHPCDMEPILESARKYGLAVIEDACEGIGAEFNGRRLGTFGDAGVFSFYPNKQMTLGEGGAIVTNDPSRAENFRSLRNQGRDNSSEWLEHSQIG